MRLSALVAVIAGTGIAQVAAVPIRVIMVSSSAQDTPSHTHVRFGHAIDPNQPAVAKMVMSTNRQGAVRMGGPCKGRMNRFREKSIEISNAFRQALGMPLIENTHAHAHVHALPLSPNQNQTQSQKHKDSITRILPVPHDFNQLLKGSGDHPRPTNLLWDPQNNDPANPHHGGPHHHHGGSRVHITGPRRTFITRLHQSLMNLGMWEGRIVAFVLGCGIGVLLRMFWVLSILAYRSIKGRSAEEEEDEYAHIIFEQVEVAPPQYAYPVDEKVAVAENETRHAEEPTATTESK